MTDVLISLSHAEHSQWLFLQFDNVEMMVEWPVSRPASSLMFCLFSDPERVTFWDKKVKVTLEYNSSFITC